LARQLGAAWAGERAEDLPVDVNSAIIFAPAGGLVPPALTKLAKGGTLALAGIHMSDIPGMSYETCLFYEKTVRSVTANTREDGRQLLQEAARGGVQPRITTYPLAEANRALQDLKADRINGSGVLLISDAL
jgi:propanol-preferring alcohol dehydrogenase